jgi:hypothetical protein
MPKFIEFAGKQDFQSYGFASIVYSFSIASHVAGMSGET